VSKWLVGARDHAGRRIIIRAEKAKEKRIGLLTVNAIAWNCYIKFYRTIICLRVEHFREDCCEALSELPFFHARQQAHGSKVMPMANLTRAPHRKPKWVQWRQPTWVHRDARGNVVYGSHSGNLDWAHEAAHVGPMMGQLRLSSWVRCDSLLTFANICISTTIIKELASAIHSPVAMVGLAPPNTTPRPPKLKQNTLNQWSLCQILECQATLHKRKAHWRPPGDDSGRLLAKTAISCVLVVFKAES